MGEGLNGDGARVPAHPHAGADAAGLGDGRVLSTLSDVPDVLLKVRQDMREEGRRRAEARGAVAAQPGELAALEQHAKAAARELYRDDYSPAWLEHDRLREAEYEKLRADRAEAELAWKNAAAGVAECERAAAAVRHGVRRPAASPAITASAVIVLSLTLMPTIYDAIFVALVDEVTGMFLSLLVAASFGAFVALGILSNLEDSERRTVANWAGLGGGSVIVVGLALFRLKDTTGAGELLFCAALVCVEVGSILFLEGYAASLRAAHHRFAAAQAGADREQALLEAAVGHQQRCEQRLAHINESVAGHIRFVEERHARRYHINEIEAAAVEAVRDGYDEGAAANRGRLVGAKGGHR